jgi:propionyl-CoA carboxylase alpha chain
MNTRPIFQKLLVANRGEIACRVIRTAQRLGIPTVAVYSEADQGSLHVTLADEAILIGAAPTSESYLDIDCVLKACQAARVDAVHPGYGFLSENPRFVEALEQAGISFVGPPARAIKKMGDKIASKQLAASVGVSVIPGYDGIVSTVEDAVQRAHEIGYPVMLKASAGGGGKGLRIAENDNECQEGFRRARSEAATSFGDDRILIERYIREPRHIEIQVIGDTHGNCIYLGERECSIQRRHQKVIEEAPSPFLDGSMRRAMGEQALALAKAVDYCSAGTVEFIADVEGRFYFLEMNTRLQVEHPVTEMITGLDLVELMLCIAAGQKLPITQDEVEINGWSIETRLYAEDPSRAFLPATGRLIRYMEPPTGPGVRVDSGVREGDEIGIYYDPMLAKLITHGRTRSNAIDAMRSALNQYCIEGVTSNLSLLAQVMAHPRFVRGDLSTNFIDEEYPDGFVARPLDRAGQLQVAAVSAVLNCYKSRPTPRPVREKPICQIVRIEDKSFHTECTVTDIDYRIQVDGARFVVVTDNYRGQIQVTFTINGDPFHAQVRSDSFRYSITHDGVESVITVLRPEVDALYQLMPDKAAPDRSHYLVAPMPGLLVSLSAKSGQKVRAGDELAVVEAMKMENSLKADRGAIISKVYAIEGQILEQDDLIIEFERKSL